MESCLSCGASLAPEAQWCSQCYAVRGAAPAGVPVTVTAGAPSPVPPASPVPMSSRFGGPAVASGRPVPAPTVPTAPPLKTRWRKTATTFGPLGRMLATIALVVPFIAFVVIGILTGGFTIAGAVIWGFIIMPWGLRDTWKAGQLPAR